jgi:hypothetical protein
MILGLVGVNGFWTFIECPFSKTSDLPEKRRPEKRVVTIMLSFPFFLGKYCDANFFRHFYRKVFRGKYYIIIRYKWI